MSADPSLPRSASSRHRALLTHDIDAGTRTVRLGLGHTRDVSMIDGEVEVLGHREGGPA